MSAILWLQCSLLLLGNTTRRERVDADCCLALRIILRILFFIHLLVDFLDRCRIGRAAGFHGQRLLLTLWLVGETAKKVLLTTSQHVTFFRYRPTVSVVSVLTFYAVFRVLCFGIPVLYVAIIHSQSLSNACNGTAMSSRPRTMAFQPGASNGASSSESLSVDPTPHGGNFPKPPGNPLTLAQTMEKLTDIVGPNYIRAGLAPASPSAFPLPLQTSCPPLITT